MSPNKPSSEPPMKDYYELLGLTPGADRDMILARYDAIMLQIEPLIEHAERTPDVVLAYLILEDDRTRKEYDDNLKKSGMYETAGHIRPLGEVIEAIMQELDQAPSLTHSSRTRETDDEEPMTPKNRGKLALDLEEPEYTPPNHKFRQQNAFQYLKVAEEHEQKEGGIRAAIAQEFERRLRIEKWIAGVNASMDGYWHMDGFRYPLKLVPHAP